MPVIAHLPADENHSGHCIRIGLVNNMPDEALRATKRQFVSLLDSASDGMQIQLSLYTLPGVPRNELSSRHIAAHYSSIDDLWEGQLDGLIVTGREPLAADLRDEPYWESFTRTLEWAKENAHSTIWSCLAAHAAVLHMEGIERVKRNDKLFGIFACERADDHPLMAGMPRRLRLPHSRWNGLAESSLTGAGYRVLTRTADGEIDTFIQQHNKLFIFFQGHPEYETDTLQREYRRDVGRYFKGEAARYPLMPQDYFDQATDDALTALREKESAGKSCSLFSRVVTVLENSCVENTWQPSAAGIYRNWLAYIRAQKQTSMPPTATPAIAEMAPAL